MFYFKPLLPAKIQQYSPFYIAFSSEKVTWSEVLFTSKNSSKQIYWRIMMWENNRGYIFFIGRTNIIDYGLLARNNILKWKRLDGLVSYKHILYLFTFSQDSLIDELEKCGLSQCIYQLFGVSFWWHPFTAEDPLVSKWCNGKVLQISFDVEKLTYILDGLGVSTFSANWNYSLNHQNQ